MPRVKMSRVEALFFEHIEFQPVRFELTVTLDSPAEVQQLFTMLLTRFGWSIPGVILFFLFFFLFFFSFLAYFFGILIIVFILKDVS